MKYLIYLHILLMATGLILILTASYAAYKKGEGWFIRHRKIAPLGSLAALLGLSAVYILKSAAGFTHLQSPHAIAGAITVALLVITPTLGSMIARDPKAYRNTHRVFGRVTTIGMMITALMGVARFVQIALVG